MKKLYFLPLIACLLLLAACTEGKYAAHMAKQIPMPGDTPESVGTFKVGTPYVIAGKRYYPKETYKFTQTGIASWYGPNFHKKPTANGEIFDKNELTAAHKTLQMPSLIRVTNLENGRSLVLRVNDRGPFSRGRILDVSERGAELLGFKNQGTAKVRIDLLEEDSRKIARAAQLGQDTRGYEVALNQNRVPSVQEQDQIPTGYQPVKKPVEGTRVASVQPVERVSLDGIQGHRSPDGRFMPDPVVTQQPVKPTNIFVQAGSFSVEANANRLSQKLSAYGPSNVYLAKVDNRPFYRVRLGPYANVAAADRALASLVSAGNDSAIIIVD